MHDTVSPLTNHFLYMTGIQTLGSGCRRYGWLFLAIAGLLVNFLTENWHTGYSSLENVGLYT